ncbi:MAG: polyprenyl synthetase family protein [Fervidicoccaceae archaeon]
MIELGEFFNKVAKMVNDTALSIKGDPEELYSASFHIFRAGGKRLRPALVFASGLAFGASEENLLPFATGVELFHNFTLIHDDIMDNDEYRRGVPTVHKLYGVPVAILAGDLLFSLSLHVPLSYCTQRLSNYRCIEASRKLAWASITVAEGQALDMMFEKIDRVSEEQYMEMIYKKTAALIEASTYIGAVLGRAEERELKKISEFGKNLGLAFQIVDDILGIYGKEEETGKPVYSDLREGKKTLLVLRALELASGDDRRTIENVLGKKDLEREKYREAAEIMEKLGVLEYAKRKAEGLVEEALRNLESLKGFAEDDYLVLLRDIAYLVIKRRK